jgi:site-specific DNA recombinase
MRSHDQEHTMSQSPAAPYAAIYARVSTEDQGKGFSIPTQIEACRQLATREGYTIPEIHVLIDEGISGTTLDRPGLRRLRELVQAQAIAAVIVIDPDRLSRNLGHQLLLAKEMERAGVKLLIVSHPLEQGPKGWLFFQMRGALAEYERAKTVERTMRGRIGRVKAGHPHGGHASLGYRYVSEPHAGHWEVEPEEAALVRRIFALWLSGMSTRAIARQLTREHVPTRLDRHPTSGGRKTLGPGLWAGPMVQRMLTYEGYIGRAYWGKRKGISKTRRPIPLWALWACHDGVADEGSAVLSLQQPTLVDGPESMVSRHDPSRDHRGARLGCCRADPSRAGPHHHRSGPTTDWGR